ncbi:TPA: lysis system i-spanin subunit Rz [Pseudomonas aeruginosa]|uniref:lysis system i-spanin subunit Rz n=1 Tax=Pseudomonas aeruginosa TaxID=287 RepID=UPI0008FBAF79|nr:lysis system i-spanin subunit Rz [Pseudomonas aeruginosa]EIU1322939.1 lysis protein [Pseudomonas aeruginosa]EKX2007136.1 lysis protein [Pseudomonas aeruginosa]KSJ44234.2 lysis protein [Pseudomonas aeruginosa]MBA4919810.1 lysis protein [Pseudomonas aeruginosa]MBG4309526.1 lysis protein [Pseudomonas aeruginosa]
MSLGGTRLVVLAALLVGICGGAWLVWEWQENACGRQLSDQAVEYDRKLAAKDRDYGREREAAAAAVLVQLEEQQAARRALETRLQAQTQAHWKEMKDAHQTQTRLRDRLATADLRLSILVDAGSVAAQGCDCGLREATSAGGLVHGAVRAQLDRAHAQRIVAITDEGDRGLIALQACQAYVKEVKN